MMFLLSDILTCIPHDKSDTDCHNKEKKKHQQNVTKKQEEQILRVTAWLPIRDIVFNHVCNTLAKLCSVRVSINIIIIVSLLSM